MNKIFGCEKSSSRRPAVFLKLEGIFDLFQGNLQNLKKEMFFFRTFWREKAAFKYENFKNSKDRKTVNITYLPGRAKELL